MITSGHGLMPHGLPHVLTGKQLPSAQRRPGPPRWLGLSGRAQAQQAVGQARRSWTPADGPSPSGLGGWRRPLGGPAAYLLDLVNICKLLFIPNI